MTTNFLNHLHLEHRVAAILGIAGLVLSIVVGFGAGIGADVVFLRAVLFGLIFAGIGFGGVFVLKKYVPELYDSFAGLSSSGDQAVTGDQGTAAEPGGASIGGDRVDEVEMAEPVAAAAGNAPEAGGFSDLSVDGMPHFSTKGAAADGKLGKHVVEKDTMVHYEPKIMAQAIRTMMGKDTD